MCQVEVEFVQNKSDAYANFGWICPSGSGEEVFKKFSIMYFYYFAIISGLRKVWSFIWKNWIIFNQWCFVSSLVENGQWFWRRRFLKVLKVFLQFPNYLPFEKGVALHLYKLESPSPKNALCPVSLKLDQ